MKIYYMILMYIWTIIFWIAGEEGLLKNMGPFMEIIGPYLPVIVFIFKMLILIYSIRGIFYIKTDIEIPIILVWLITFIISFGYNYLLSKDVEIQLYNISFDLFWVFDIILFTLSTISFGLYTFYKVIDE
ncbi:MAG TPA: hypothetical protein IAC14_14175 [Candidatus Scybalomonas excrementigallinarum]|nr:hypothetical protein [Candidatus Scybalomonas excrementigallinarum]